MLSAKMFILVGKIYYSSDRGIHTRGNMRSGTIDALRDLDTEDRLLGLRRLGVVFSESLSIQHLSLRDVEVMTERWYGGKLNKETCSRLCNGKTTPTLYTLNRMAPLCFKVKYFETSKKNPVGRPVFSKDLDYSDRQLRLNLEFTRKVEDLPDIEHRYSNVNQLIKIITGEIPLMQTLNQLPNR